MSRKVLGRGLSALIPDRPAPAVPAATAVAPAHAGTPPTRDYFLCPIADIVPNRQQPRQQFADQALEELVQSIRQVGVIQPLIVRQSGKGYVLIAGERRWRAAQRAGLERVPVVVREVDDRLSLELALVENLQRADLNPIEEAEAYQRLIEDHGHTQTHLAERLGRDRTTVTNALRLLQLPEPVQRAVIDQQISGGHARTLLGLENAGAIIEAMALVIRRQLSVRQTEALVRQLRASGTGQPGEAAPLSANARDLQDRLRQSLKTRVQLKPGRDQRGRIEIHYNSLDELDRLLKVLLP